MNMKTETLASILIKAGLVPPQAVEDPEGFDNYATAGRIAEAAVMVTAKESTADGVIVSEMRRGDAELLMIIAAKLDRPVETISEGIGALSKERDAWRACADSLREELARVQAIVGPVDYDLIAPHLAEFDNLTRKASAEPTRPVADPEEYSTPLCRDCRSPLPVGAVTGDRCPICQEEESQWQAHAEEAACHAPEGGAR